MDEGSTYHSGMQVQSIYILSIRRVSPHVGGELVQVYDLSTGTDSPLVYAAPMLKNCSGQQAPW